ncbi:hypothetical protein CR513_55540, partial [Mucuna pruriens]
MAKKMNVIPLVLTRGRARNLIEMQVKDGIVSNVIDCFKSRRVSNKPHEPLFPVSPPVPLGCLTRVKTILTNVLLTHLRHRNQLNEFSVQLINAN